MIEARGAPPDPNGAFDVVILGAGVAGTGAALAAASARGRARVAILDGGTGASTLASGALDWVDWRRDSGPAIAMPLGAAAALDALDALATYVVPQATATLLTTAGVVRPARGHDRALLNVPPHARRVGVVACRRPGWDAAVLAAAWTEAPGGGLRAFEALGATVVRYTDESVIPDPDFAARHDDELRLEWLAERLREALAQTPGRWDALALPPMLGSDTPRAEALSRRVGLPCGEAIALPGGPAGLRFERARDRALRAAHVACFAARADAVERRGDRWRVTSEAGEIFDARAVVLATGGLVGGGLEYAPSDAIFASALPPIARPALRLTVRVPFVVGARGLPLDLPGSLFGSAPEALSGRTSGDSLLHRAGVLEGRDANGDPIDGRERGLFAAGDVAADEARTWLGALASGAHAGLRAAEAAGREATESKAPTARSSAPSPDEGPASLP